MVDAVTDDDNILVPRFAATPPPVKNVSAFTIPVILVPESCPTFAVPAALDFKYKTPPAANTAVPLIESNPVGEIENFPFVVPTSVFVPEPEMVRLLKKLAMPMIW